MYDAIEERNELITSRRDSPDPAVRRSVKGMRVMKAATMHRLRATLRAALNAAIRQRIIDVNPAAHVELPPTRRPKALVWTENRVQHWRKTGEVPSPVMVWTPDQTGAFLDHLHAAGDRLYALYHLIAHTGLRRGEACGLHWADLDLDARTMTVRWQITQLGWATHLEPPKTDSSDAVVALDTGTVAALREHRRPASRRPGRHPARSGPTPTSSSPPRTATAPPRRRHRPLPRPHHPGRPPTHPTPRPATRRRHPRPRRRRRHEDRPSHAAPLLHHDHRRHLHQRPTRTRPSRRRENRRHRPPTHPKATSSGTKVDQPANELITS